jgi:hypothetical protein
MRSGIRVVPNPKLFQELEAEVSKGLADASLAAAVELERRISRGGRKGKQYRDAKHPKRSSAPGEYPQEQMGDLKRSVNANQASKLEFEVGFFGGQDLVDKAMYLEYFGEPGSGAGIRRPLFMLFFGKDSKRTLGIMRKAMAQAMS